MGKGTGLILFLDVHNLLYLRAEGKKERAAEKKKKMKENESLDSLSPLRGKA